MTSDLLQLARSYVTPDLIQRLSGVVNEAPNTTRKAVDGIIPTMLAGIANLASSPSGATALTNLIEREQGDRLLPNFGDQLGGSALTGLLSSGKSIFGTLFGAKTDLVTSSIASQAGARESSVSTLMSLAAPLVIGLLGRVMRSDGLSTAGLASMLESQKQTFVKYLPSDLAGALNITSTPTYTPVAATEPIMQRSRGAVIATTQGRGSVLRWAMPLLLLVGFLGLWVWMRQPEDQTRGRLASITLPGGVPLNVSEGSINYNLAQYLNNSNDTEVPKRFVFDTMNFETNSATIREDSIVTIKGLTAILKAYPTTLVRLEGHTDSTGDAGANKELSRQRAEALRNVLVQNGIAADRISIEGFGSERPIAPNATEEGRARNRRTELVVIKKV